MGLCSALQQARRSFVGIEPVEVLAEVERSIA